MSSKDKYKQIGQMKIVQKRQEGNNTTNNIKSYSINKVVVENSTKTSYNNGKIYTQNNTSQNRVTQYQAKNQFPVITNQFQNSKIGQSKNITVYEYSPANTNNMNSTNLKHHPNQVNNLIHNHKFYTSITTKAEKVSRTSQSENKTRSERSGRSERVQSLSPVGKNKYIVETKKVEIFSKPRYSSVSSSSRETNVSISKSQVKNFMTKMWLEEIYCSNVESLCCLVDNQNSQRNNQDFEMYEKELEKNAIIIKDYEAQIKKLKSMLNIKEQEMKRMLQNLQQTENNLKIKNKQIYELNIKTAKNEELLDKDSHELQIISMKKEKNKNKVLDKDAHSLQIISLKSKWNDILIPSPVNEIYIQTIKNYEEIKRIQMRKEEEIRKRELEKISNLEFQEMGTLSILTRKPKKINLCQRLESIMIISKQRIAPLQLQKIDKINIVPRYIKPKNEIQELDGLEIIHMKKNKIVRLVEQRLNGLEIQREYDMLLVKPVWNSLKIQGTGLNLIAMPRDVQLENQEIDEFEILGTKPEKIKVLIPVAENNMQKITNFEIIGKVKLKADLKIKKERIKFDGKPKKEPKNWNDFNRLIKTTKLFLRRNYQKIEPKEEIDWNEINKPIKSTKLSIKGFVKKEIPKKAVILKRVRKDNFGFKYSIPEKEEVELDIESFNVKLIAKKKEIKKPLKEVKVVEKKKISLIKNRIDSINIFGLKSNILIPSLTEKINLISKVKKVSKNWDNYNKVMKTRELTIPRKIKVENKISKKVVNIEIKVKPKKEIVLKPIKAHKLLIRGSIKKVIQKPILKQINENKLFISSIPRIVKKPEIILKQKKETKLFIKGLKKVVEKQIIERPIVEKVKVINWNELIKIQKNQNVNIIHKVPKVIYKKQNLNAFSYKGIKKQIQIQKKPSEKLEIIKNDWSNLLKTQRNSKFIINGQIKPMKLLIVKVDKFTLKREPEEEIIFNDDYNYLEKQKKENGKQKAEKEIVLIKEKEITPIMQREIRAQVVRVKEESSETSSQSDVDVLAAIKKQGMLNYAGKLDSKSSGYYKKVINGEVIFTPKTNLGVNLGGAKYKKEILVKNGIIINKKEQGRISGIEISGNNGQIYHEKMSGIGGAIKEGNYQIINGNNFGENNQKKLTSLYQSTVNIRNSNKGTKMPKDSKKKDLKPQFIVRKKLKIDNEAKTVENMGKEYLMSGNMNNNENKKIIFKSNMTSEIMKHSSSSSGLVQGKGNTISVKKEIYTYEHRYNGNFNNTDQ